ncbi:hypothetical protein BDN72DRAFT_840682 [Pluteus cervinus]|uniref:Uncharacterized protein n=1 Tax=Pluteus cervinus TaxID=181527 RepID=A0ACD3AUA3_9AGAR|nr:hypothetical protein BDN72DRAFT_840682 [Pluteus cervinus]
MSSLPFEYPWVSKLQSPIPDIIDRNGCLKDESTTKVQNYLSELASEKVSLEGAISQAKAIIDHLERAKTQLENAERVHTAFICASRRCPPEIISLIMIASMELSRDDPPHRTCAPMVFCSVSREWRYIAVSTPQLWTNIVLNVSPKNITGKEDLLEMWLKRSKGNLLDVYLTDSYSPRSHALLSTILKESTRWRTARLKLQTHALEQLCPGIELPNLRTLDIRSFYHGQSIYLTNCFAQAPLLSEITSTSGGPSFGWLNWDNITHWTFDRVTTSDVVGLLWHARQLIECRISSMENQTKDPHAAVSTYTAALPHTSLRLLDVTCPSSDELIAFCPHIELPSLASLRVSITRASTKLDKVGIPPSLETFLLQCSGTLESLELSKDLCAMDGLTVISDGVLVKCLKKMEKLRTLRLACRSLTRPSLNDKFVRALTTSSDSEDSKVPVVLPNLEELRLQGVLGFTTDALIAMVRSRGYPNSSSQSSSSPLGAGADGASQGGQVKVTRLKRLRVDIDTPFIGLKPKKYEELIPLREEGLNVVAMCRGNRLW